MLTGLPVGDWPYLLQAVKAPLGHRFRSLVQVGEPTGEVRDPGPGSGNGMACPGPIDAGNIKWRREAISRGTVGW